MKLRADGETVRTKSVQVQAGQTKPVEFVFSSDENEKVTLAVNDQEAGTVTFGSPPLIPPKIQKFLGGGLGAIGGMLLISGFILEVLRLGKKYVFGRQPTTTERQVNKVSGAGFLLLVPAAYFFGFGLMEIAMVFGGMIGLVSFFAGWKWVFRKV